MLSDADRQNVQRVFTLGPESLVDTGMTDKAIGLFLMRPEIVQALRDLLSEYDSQHVQDARVKFGARRDLARLLPGATAVLARAMAGVTYARDPVTGAVVTDSKGKPVILDGGVTSSQLRAASQVLDRMGIKPDSKTGVISVNINTILKKDRAAVTVQLDPALATEEQQALSREVVRNFLSRMRGKLTTIVRDVEPVTGVTDPVTMGPKPKPKPTKKPVPRPPVR